MSEADVLESLKISHDGIRELIAHAERAARPSRRQPKMSWTKAEPPEGVVLRAKELASGKISRGAQPEGQAHAHRGRRARQEGTRGRTARPSSPTTPRTFTRLLGDVEYHELRSQVLDTRTRVDGRKPNEVRDISVDTRLLPRSHGSALFTRGQTQALVAATLGTAKDAQRLDSVERGRRDDASRSCCTTTSRRSPLVKCVRCAAPAAAKSAMATWPSARCRPCCPTSPTSRTRFASCPTCSSPTARRRWRRCAAVHSRCSMLACR